MCNLFETCSNTRKRSLSPSLFTFANNVLLVASWCDHFSDVRKRNCRVQWDPAVADKYRATAASCDVRFLFITIIYGCGFRLPSYPGCSCRPEEDSTTRLGAAMTSRPPPSDTRRNTAPLLPATMELETGSIAVTRCRSDGLPFLWSIWVTHGDIRGYNSAGGEVMGAERGLKRRQSEPEPERERRSAAHRYDLSAQGPSLCSAPGTKRQATELTVTSETRKNASTLVI